MLIDSAWNVTEKTFYVKLLLSGLCRRLLIHYVLCGIAPLVTLFLGYILVKAIAFLLSDRVVLAQQKCATSANDSPGP
jgi:hypothetical protein